MLLRRALQMVLYGILATVPLLQERAARADTIYVGFDDIFTSFEAYDPAGSPTEITSFKLREPRGIVFDDSGNIYVLNKGDGAIIKIINSWGLSSIFCSTGLPSASAMARDNVGNFYVADSFLNIIEKFSRDGTDLGTFADGLDDPEALAFGPDGNLYVANAGDNTIVRFMDTGYFYLYASTGLSQPDSLAFDKDGVLFAANRLSNTIVKFASDGTGTSSLFATTASGLKGLAFDSSGNLYAAISESPIRRIQKFLPDGSSSTFADTGRLPLFIAVEPDADAVIGAKKWVAGTFTPGSTVTYTIVLSNSGIEDMPDNPGNELTDVLPAGLALVNATATSGTVTATIPANTVTWNGIIPGSGSVVLTITCMVFHGTGGGIANQASFKYDADFNGSNESSGVTDDPTLPGSADPTSFVVVNSPAVEVPTLSAPSFLILGLCLLVAAWIQLRRRPLTARAASRS